MVAEAVESPAVDPERDLLVWWVRKGELGAGDMVDSGFGFGGGRAMKLMNGQCYCMLLRRLDADVYLPYVTIKLVCLVCACG